MWDGGDGQPRSGDPEGSPERRVVSAITDRIRHLPKRECWGKKSLAEHERLEVEF